MRFKELDFLQDGDLSWDANGYRVTPPANVDLMSAQALKDPNPGVVFMAVLAHARHGQFDSLPRLVECMRKTENPLLWRGCSQLLGDAGALRHMEDALEQFRQEAFDERLWYIGLEVCEMLHQSLMLWTVPVMLALYLESPDRRQLGVIEFFVARILESELEWGKGLLHRLTGEDFARAALGKYHALREQLGTEDVPVLYGELFSVRSLAEHIHAGALRDNTAVRLTVNDRHNFEAATGRDCRSWFKEGRRSPLAIAAQMELFLQGPDVAKFQPGVRYFHGYPIPIETRSAATGSIRETVWEYSKALSALRGSAPRPNAGEQKPAAPGPVSEEEEPRWDELLYDRVDSALAQSVRAGASKTAWKDLGSVLVKARSGDLRAVENALQVYRREPEDEELQYLCATLLGDAYPSSTLRDMVNQFHAVLFAEQEWKYQEFFLQALHQSRLLWAVPVMLRILQSLVDPAQALPGRLLVSRLMQAHVPSSILRRTPADEFLSQSLARYEDLRERLNTDDIAVLYGEKFSVKRVAVSLQEHLKDATPVPALVYRERHLLQVSTGIDLSGFYPGGNLNPQAAQKLLARLLGSGVLEPYEEGKRYFYGRPVPD